MLRTRRHGPLQVVAPPRRRGRLPAAVGSVLLLAGLAWTASGWRVSEVRVVGASGVSPDLVVRVAALRPGQSMLTLRPDEVSRRVEELAEIRSAHVRRALWSRVIVRVEERRGLARVDGATGRLADAAGVVFPGAGDGLPLLTGFGEAPEDGQQLASHVRAVLAALPGFPENLRSRIVKLAAGTELTAVLVDGTEVRFGRAEELGRKASAAAAVLDDAARRGSRLAYIDVRTPRTPVARDAATPAPTASARPRVRNAAAPTPSPARTRTTPRPTGAR